MIIIGGPILLVVIIALVLGIGFGVDASNCWALDGVDYCDYKIEMKVEKIPNSNTRALVVNPLCSGILTSVANEGELHAIIGSLSDRADTGFMFWDWSGTIYVRINMTENSGGSSVAKSKIASSMAGNKV